MWIRFSDYELRTAEDGTSYVCPSSGSIASFYDPMLMQEKLAVSVLDAAQKHKSDPGDDSIILTLVRSFGLPGFALDRPDEYVFPFGRKNAEVINPLLSQRGEECALVFSADYAEKYDDIVSWLDRIADQLSCTPASDGSGCGSVSGSDKEAPACMNLAEMAGQCICSLSEAGKLHVCVQCGKIYFSEDPESETCSKKCEFQYSVSDSAPASKKRFIGHLISGG